jgi:hypothetical protein
VYCLKHRQVGQVRPAAWADRCWELVVMDPHLANHAALVVVGDLSEAAALVLVLQRHRYRDWRAVSDELIA